MSLNDTIVACATAAGYSSIAVIRVSGPQTKQFINRIFQAENTIVDFVPNRVYYGRIINPNTDDLIDRVLVTFFKGPHSYTGEDMAEVSCHGNPVIVEKIVNLLTNLGAHIAQRGEFSKRSLLNGKIDLLQAEAVLDTIQASCDEARKLAIAQYEGNLSEKIYELRAQIIDLLSLVEADIDFPEEEDVADILTSSKAKLTDKISVIISAIDILLKGAVIGRKIKEGYKILIVGRSNVGKSTLFNKILGYDRAIIHEKPGTTRDYIDDSIELDGLYIRLYDTAGFLDRATGSDVIAQQRSLELLNQADLVVLVFDGSEPLNEQDIFLYNLGEKEDRILVVNKIDMNIRLNESSILSDSIKLSAKTGENIDVLTRCINEKLNHTPMPGQVLLTRQRHIDALTKVKDCLEKGVTALSSELVAFELHSALEIVGELTGKVMRKDILEKIFNQFCIGK